MKLYEIVKHLDWDDKLHDSQEIADYIQSTSSDDVDVELIEEYYFDCEAILKHVLISSLTEGNTDTNMRDKAKEKKYNSLSFETMPPIIVSNGVVEDGNHRFRVAKDAKRTHIWIYDIQEIKS